MRVLNEIICIFQLKLVRIIIKKQQKTNFIFKRNTTFIPIFRHPPFSLKNHHFHLLFSSFQNTRHKILPSARISSPFPFYSVPSIFIPRSISHPQRSTPPRLPLPSHPSLMLPKECRSQQQCVKHCLVFSRKKQRQIAMSSKILKEPAGDKFEIALKCLNKHINTI